MANEWIIDVLGDLRAFAVDNALPTLADQLDEALAVAAVEVAQEGARFIRAGEHVGTADHFSGATL